MPESIAPAAITKVHEQFDSPAQIVAAINDASTTGVPWLKVKQTIYGCFHLDFDAAEFEKYLFVNTETDCHEWRVANYGERVELDCRISVHESIRAMLHALLKETDEAKRSPRWIECVGRLTHAATYEAVDVSMKGIPKAATDKRTAKLEARAAKLNEELEESERDVWAETLSKLVTNVSELVTKINDNADCEILRVLQSRENWKFEPSVALTTVDSQIATLESLIMDLRAKRQEAVEERRKLYVEQAERDIEGHDNDDPEAGGYLPDDARALFLKWLQTDQAFKVNPSPFSAF